jgi:PiT family inorganic phosphate transporter
MSPITDALSTGSLFLLVLALALALSFEFVNGFHDTANAVATVIYTNTLKPWIAVIWSGCWNLIGVLWSGGLVAFSILALLPVELILNTGTGAGFAMVFALLISAIIWNLGTWWLGLPASSSHSMIGSIMGVGLANALMAGKSFNEGINWAKAQDVFTALLVSPLVGFTCAALLLLVLKWVVRNKALMEAPQKDTPPPLWIRAILVLTCTGVSFSHGSNDGQKGMGLIMLILIGIMPAAYALNLGYDHQRMVDLYAENQKIQIVLDHQAHGPAAGASATAPAVLAPSAHVAPDAASATAAIAAEPATAAIADAEPATAAAVASATATATAAAPAGDGEKVLAAFIKASGSFNDKILGALAAQNRRLGDTFKAHPDLDQMSIADRRTLRTSIFIASETLAKLKKKKLMPLDDATAAAVGTYQSHLEGTVKYIPVWVKVAVAFALGLGTMIGWKRIVVTVGEKIGKSHLTYGQGASAELVAFACIQAADNYGLPVSTTHVLSSGVAGTMAANRSGLQMATLRNLLLAWVLTLPVCMLLGACTFAGGLYVVFHLFGS